MMGVVPGLSAESNVSEELARNMLLDHSHLANLAIGGPKASRGSRASGSTSSPGTALRMPESSLGRTPTQKKRGTGLAWPAGPAVAGGCGDLGAESGAGSAEICQGLAGSGEGSTVGSGGCGEGGRLLGRSTRGMKGMKEDWGPGREGTAREMERFGVKGSLVRSGLRVAGRGRSGYPVGCRSRTGRSGSLQVRPSVSGLTSVWRPSVLALPPKRGPDVERPDPERSDPTRSGLSRSDASRNDPPWNDPTRTA